MKKKSLLLFLLMILFVAVDGYSRAGGGGGGGGSDDIGGGIEGIIWIIYFLISVLPFPLNIIAIIAIIMIALMVFRKRKQATSGYNTIAPRMHGLQSDQDTAEAFEKYGISKEAFKQKIGKAFMDIQQAWMKQDLGQVRRYISDGVYQRFQTQFRMMKLLEQENILENIRLLNTTIIRIREDGPYIVAHVKIEASMNDTFRSKKYSNISASYLDHFVEYWSFIKLKQDRKKDLFHSYNCPNCGGALPEESGETSQCPYCSTITNSGEFDWILAEITQADDFVSHFNNPRRERVIPVKIQQNGGLGKDFSIQWLEDKASNGFLQIYTALVTKDVTSVRRFVSDAVFARIQDRVEKEIPFIYHRFYLNDVTVSDIYTIGNLDHILLTIKFTFQKVRIKGDKASFVEHAPVTREDIIVMQREQGAGIPAGKLYAHSCPNCGGPLKDTLDVQCPYCGSAVNSPKHEWIITEWEDVVVYKNAQLEKQRVETAAALHQSWDTGLEVRDYAFNNMLVVMTADGVITEEEKAMIYHMERMWNFSPEKVRALLDLANSHRLSLRMPHNKEAKAEVIQYMERAAAADHHVSEEEKQLIETAKSM